jgi:hypothetical protein
VHVMILALRAVDAVPAYATPRTQRMIYAQRGPFVPEETAQSFSTRAWLQATSRGRGPRIGPDVRSVEHAAIVRIAFSECPPRGALI